MTILALKNAYHKNGIWWWSKIVNRVIGENNYDSLRVQNRVASMKFYYFRQQLLYRCFIQTPDLANLLGIYPKCNNTHGFGFYNTYEMYRDFQQNTINSDGSFGMWISAMAGLYLIHELYNYIFPWYWCGTAGVKNGEEEMYRMKDALASTTLQESIGLAYGEWGWMPHDWHSIRTRVNEGLSHPDDVRAMHMSGVNRKNRYVEHYRKKIGDDQSSMIKFN